MSKETTIRIAFETALVAGLQGSPVVVDGEVMKGKDGEAVMAAPEASFLSVVRAYLKDQAPAAPDTKGKAVPAGEAAGILDTFLKTQGKALPFAGRQ